MKKPLILLIRLYQIMISPYIGAGCRFYPTCSQYGIDAIKKHGAFKGTLKTIYRVLRCNPYNHGGVDEP